MNLISVASLAACVSVPVCAQVGQMIQKSDIGTISFRLDGRYFDSLKNDAVRRWSEEDNGGGLPDGIAPAHSRFRFKLVRPVFLKNEKGWNSPECVIRIIPLTDVSVPSFEKSYSFLNRNAVEVLSIYSRGRASIDSGKILPDWECADCNQYFHSKFGMVASSVARGFHYLTSCRQEPTALENGEVHFVINAVSSDFKYYIYIDIPVCHPSLPFRDSELPNRSEGDISKYYEASSARLNSFDNGSYWPSLDAAISLFKSIKIE